MPKVMSNSSPIIALSMIGLLPLMTELFENVYIPGHLDPWFVCKFDRLPNVQEG